MMKKSLMLAAGTLLSLAAVLGGCGGGGDKKQAAKTDSGKELTVYTARSESLNNAVIQNFE